MLKIDRRTFVKATGGAAAVAALSGFPYVAKAAGQKVVIVGGGPAGATTAKVIKMTDPSIEVTLVEANREYHTCFMSNEFLGGMRSFDSLKVTYDALKKRGINVVIDEVTGIDAAGKKVATKSGQSLAFDRCVVAPGIDFKYGVIEGTVPAMAETIPHAWKAGPQTLLLRRQLEAMPDGGTVVIVAPPDPFRCPPGPYERASMIAWYLKNNKPKSKLIIIDQKEAFSKQGLFIQAWKKFYGYETDKSLISWLPASRAGKILKVDVKTKEIETEFEKVKADVFNFIPHQTAGQVAHAAKLVNEKGWCPVNRKTFESSIAPGVHVLGDASDAATMPKSGYSANSQGKVCGAAIVALLKGQQPGEPSYVNTCYSVAAKDHAFSVAGIYRYNAADNTIAGVKDAGGLSPIDASDEYRKREVSYAHSWFGNVKQDIWG